MNSLQVLSENYISINKIIIYSSGAGDINNQNPDAQWVSSGSSEGDTQTIEITLLDLVANNVSRTFDRIVFLNCNLAQFYVQYWTGSTWATITEADYSVTPNAATDLYIEVAAAKTSTKIKIVMTNTIGAVAEKRIGEFKICSYITAIRHKVAADVVPWQNAFEFRLQGGALVTYTDLQKWEASMTIDQVSQATYAVIISYLRLRSWMTWVLHDDFNVAHIYEVKATSPVTEKVDRKMYLYNLKFKVKAR